MREGIETEARDSFLVRRRSSTQEGTTMEIVRDAGPSGLVREEVIVTGEPPAHPSKEPM